MNDADVILSEIAFKLWLATVLLRAMTFTWIIPSKPYQALFEIAGLICACVALMAAFQIWLPFAVELAYSGTMYLIARVMTSPRFVGWLMARPPRS